MQVHGSIFVPSLGAADGSPSCFSKTNRCYTFVHPVGRKVELFNLLHPVTSPDDINLPHEMNFDLVEVWADATSTQCLKVDAHNLDLVSRIYTQVSGVNWVTNLIPDFLFTLPPFVDENMQLIEKLLKSAASIRYRHPEGGNIAHFAVERKYSDLIAVLGKCGVDLDAVRNDGLTPLCLAVTRGALATLNALLANGANVNHRLESGKTALNLAVEGKFPEAVTALAKKGADLNLKAEGGWTLLHTAANKGDIAMVKLLLSEGADVDPQLVGSEDGNGLTPLLLAVKQKDWNVAKEFIRRGADLKTVHIGRKALLHAADHRKKDCVDHLLQRGLNFACLRKKFSFRKADCKGLYRQDLLVIQKLAQLEISIPFEEIFGPNLLFSAIFEDMYWLVRKLLDLGADVNQKHAFLHPKRRTTPLRVACRFASTDVVGLLLDRGADPRGATWQGVLNSPIANAIMAENLDTVQLLLDKNVSVRHPEYLRFAFQEDNHELIELLILNGCYVHSQDLGPLLSAVKRNTCDHCAATLFYYGVHISWGTTVVENDLGRSTKYSAPPWFLKVVLEHTFGDIDSPGEARVSWDNFLFDLVNGSISLERIKFARILATHLVKLKAAGKTVADDVIPVGIQELYPGKGPFHIFDVNEFEAKCEEELERLKEKTVIGTDATFFDVLTKDTNLLSRIITQEASMLSLLEFSNNKKFSLYQGIISCRLGRVLWKRKFFGRGFKAFTRLIFRLPKLPIELKERIVRMLSSQDIISLEMSFRLN